MSAGFSALSSALFALAWTIPDNRFITLMLVWAFLRGVRTRSEHVGTRPSRAGRAAGVEPRGATMVLEFAPQGTAVVAGEQPVAQLAALGAPEDRVVALPALGSQRLLGD